MNLKVYIQNYISECFHSSETAFLAQKYIWTLYTSNVDVSYVIQVHHSENMQGISRNPNWWTSTIYVSLYDFYISGDSLCIPVLCKQNLIRGKWWVFTSLQRTWWRIVELFPGVLTATQSVCVLVLCKQLAWVKHHSNMDTLIPILFTLTQIGNDRTWLSMDVNFARRVLSTILSGFSSRRKS